MKKSTIISLAFIFILAVVFSGCGGLNKMKKNAGLVTYQVNPEVLEMHADSVAVNITGKFPEKYFNKKATLVATPVLKHANGEKSFKPVKVQGEKVDDNNKVINFVDGGSFSYSDQIPYSEDMKISELELRIQAYVKPEKPLDFDPRKIADGVIATPSLLQFDAKPILGKDKFQRIISDSKSADIHFNIQQANLRNSELREDDIKALEEYIEEAKEHERKEFKGVSVSAYASPDGGLDLNTGLAEKRAVTAEKYVKRNFKKVEEAEKEGFVKAASTPEDWDGFKSEMQASDIADKDLILRVLQMHSDPEVRETEIKKIAATYVEIADKVLPKLRRSKLNVNVDLIGYSDEEIVQIFNEKPDSLKIEEILYAGTLTKDYPEKAKIYKASSEIYADDWRTHNNLGYSYIYMDKVSDAGSAFEKASAKDENTIVINNLGVVALKNADFEAAEEKFKSAAGAGSEVNYNLGICKVKKADYAGAVSSFGNSCSFNVALAKVLNGDNDGALKAIECSENKEDAMMYYLKAVIGARTQDKDLMYNNLRTAVDKEPSLKGAAKIDMEFGKFFEDDTFKTIVGQ